MILRLDVFDTQPGATGEAAILAPPADVHSEAQYLEWLGWAQMDPQVFQLMVVVSRAIRGNSLFPRPRFSGPFAGVLEGVFKEFTRSLADKNHRRSPDGPPAISVRRDPPRAEAPLQLFTQRDL